MKSFTHQLHGHSLAAHHHAGAGEDAPLVVLVHGMMEPAAVWQPVLERLRPNYRCVSLELPWNGTQGVLWGRSMSPDGWLQAALDAFHLRPDAWVAHSFGASTLLTLLASGRTDRGVQAPAALISPFYKASSDEVTWPLFHRYVNDFTEFVSLSIRVRMGERQVDAQLLQRMTEAARDRFGCYVWMEFWRLFSGMPFLPLRRLRQPMLLMNGTDDFSSELTDTQALARALPDARLEVYPGASHFLLSSRQEAVTTAIDRFLTRVCSPDMSDRTVAI